MTADGPPPADGAVRVPTDAGPLWFPGACQVVTPVLREDGAWEPDELAALMSHSRRGMTAVVVGAHVGYFAVHLARAAGPSGRVVAIEPDPLNAALLRANVAGLVQVEVVEAAAWAHEGTLQLFLSETNTGDHRVAAVRGESRRATPVAAVTLDGVLASADSLDLVLLDTQGAEPAVLAGAATSLSRWRPVVVTEFWPAGLRELGQTPERLLEQLHELRYRIRLLGQGRFARFRDEQLIAAAEANRGGYATLVCLPRR